MTDQVIKVLFVDDEVNNLTAFKASFRKHFQVYTAETAEVGMTILDSEDIHVVITDQYLKNTSGVAFLEDVLDHHPDVSRILITGVADMEDLIAAVNRTHIFAYLSKPWDAEVMLSLVRGAHASYMKKREKNSLIVQLQRTNEQLEFMLREKLVS